MKIVNFILTIGMGFCMASHAEAECKVDVKVEHINENRYMVSLHNKSNEKLYIPVDTIPWHLGARRGMKISVIKNGVKGPMMVGIGHPTLELVAISAGARIASIKDFGVYRERFSENDSVSVEWRYSFRDCDVFSGVIHLASPAKAKSNSPNVPEQAPPKKQARSSAPKSASDGDQ
ncbi:MAG: hypothetical protein LBP52_05570 [Burkholderiaceae bacterium]|jgi:hypothetical protein|nr:hypothetical protein [Burkholderiaceae bacterium]